MADYTHPFYGQAAFLCGAARLTQFPPDRGAEVAFAGRSNVGKSSAINAICGVAGLARTSKTPGRTQQINFFRLSEENRFVDLPGYGFAKAPDAVRRKWSAAVESYLRRRRSLRGVALLMDVRRPLTELDWQLVRWCRAAEVPFFVLLTKSDKLGRGRAETAVRETFRRLAAEEGSGDVVLFSATRRFGIDAARARLHEWLPLSKKKPRLTNRGGG